MGGLSGYRLYMERLVGEIEELRKKGLMYKDIVEMLKNRGFRSSRDKELSVKIIERMLKKKWKRDEDMKIHEFYIEDVFIDMECIGK